MGTVLIVDDQATDRELMGRVVTAAGHMPAYAGDAPEGLAKAKELKPLMVLLDIVMPGMVNGFNVCRKLKTDPTTQHIPVVLVSTKGTDSDKFWGKKQGADDHIAKPFTREQLTDVIRKYAR